jgi:hypothetical protein
MNGFKANPDAMYILAQSVLVQNIALEQARAQLAAAQQQAPQPAKANTFLGNLLGGHRDNQPPPLPPSYQPVYTPQATEYQTPYNPGPGYQGQPYQGQPYGGPQYAAPSGQPSFLRSAAQTAAGVAAGALAFEGVEALLHGGFGHPGMGMGGGWDMPGVGYGMGPGIGFERPVEETVVNNYYDSPAPEHHSADPGYSDSNWSDNAGGSFDSGSDYSDSSNNSGGSGDDGGF